MIRTADWCRKRPNTGICLTMSSNYDELFPTFDMCIFQTGQSMSAWRTVCSRSWNTHLNIQVTFDYIWKVVSSVNTLLWHFHVLFDKIKFPNAIGDDVGAVIVVGNLDLLSMFQVVWQYHNLVKRISQLSMCNIWPDRFTQFWQCSSDQ